MNSGHSPNKVKASGTLSAGKSQALMSIFYSAVIING
jgi:hypothetical protein